MKKENRKKKENWRLNQMGSIIQSGGSDASLAEANAESKSLLQLFTHLPILPAAVLTEPEGEIELG